LYPIIGVLQEVFEIKPGAWSPLGELPPGAAWKTLAENLVMAAGEKESALFEIGLPQSDEFS
jgi:hypothetical protein